MDVDRTSFFSRETFLEKTVVTTRLHERYRKDIEDEEGDPCCPSVVAVNLFDLLIMILMYREKSDDSLRFCRMKPSLHRKTRGDSKRREKRTATLTFTLCQCNSLSRT